MVSLVETIYEKRHKLIDLNYLEENVESLLLSTKYFPFTLRSFLDEIYVSPEVYEKLKKHRNEKSMEFNTNQKVLFMRFAYTSINGKKTGILFHLLELLIFLNLNPQFYGLVKDENYLKDLIAQCENEYNIDLMKYTNSYEDIKRLYNDNLHKKLTPIYDMVDHVYSNLINDELIHSKYYVHPMFLSNYAYDKRLEWIREYAFLIELNKSYITQFIKLDETEQLITVMEVMKDFIKRNPQHSQLINDYPAFNEYLESLYKKKYSENPKYKREID